MITYRTRLVATSFVFLMMAFSPSITLAHSLPTCAQLDTDPQYGLAGNRVVIVHTTTLVTTANPPYCQVDFIISERGGPVFGYAHGEIQRVGLLVGLPANTSDGGTGGSPEGEGAWNGRVRNLEVGGW